MTSMVPTKMKYAPPCRSALKHIPAHTTILLTTINFAALDFSSFLWPYQQDSAIPDDDMAQWRFCNHAGRPLLPPPLLATNLGQFGDFSPIHSSNSSHAWMQPYDCTNATQIINTRLIQEQSKNKSSNLKGRTKSSNLKGKLEMQAKLHWLCSELTSDKFTVWCLQSCNVKLVLSLQILEFQVLNIHGLDGLDGGRHIKLVRIRRESSTGDPWPIWSGINGYALGQQSRCGAETLEYNG